MNTPSISSRILLALLLLFPLAAPAAAEEDAYFSMAFPDLVTAPANAHIHTHLCVTGFVQKTRKEKDGDIHVQLCQGSLCMVLEIMPELPVARPRKGQKIQACGVVRYDGWHSWWELHPLVRWEVAR